MSLVFFIGCFTSSPILSIIAFALSQIIVGWMGHSMNHSRNALIQKIGRFYASLIGGFCLEWWAPKHNMHHMFTNS
jgi:fatty acid desaturase